MSISGLVGRDSLLKILDNIRESVKLSKRQIFLLLNAAKQVLVKEPNVLKLDAPISVVGDIHGQLFDLLEIFKIGGEVPATNYLFLGDYVDRGAFSLETVSYLLALKALYPERIFLIRGNHECRNVSRVYGFRVECQKKLGSTEEGLNVWSTFMMTFDCLPIAAVIKDDIFCVHGGLSPSIQFVEQIEMIDRFREIPHEGAFADLLWSDPSTTDPGFETSSRGAGFAFGEDVAVSFLKRNNFKLLVRAHQLCMNGFQEFFDSQVITVWSAPCYCYRFVNQASILEIDDSLNTKVNKFDAAPPSTRPDNTISAVRRRNMLKSNQALRPLFEPDPLDSRTSKKEIDVENPNKNNVDGWEDDENVDYNSGDDDALILKASTCFPTLEIARKFLKECSLFEECETYALDSMKRETALQQERLEFLRDGVSYPEDHPEFENLMEEVYESDEHAIQMKQLLQSIAVKPHKDATQYQIESSSGISGNIDNQLTDLPSKSDASSSKENSNSDSQASNVKPANDVCIV
eukprot:TRINITY_DN744_c0_g1_i1.p1 TRINITY_DN744_c0_g1~~TRINITY_DN744_c0_g1_i1.p1  ORF type:complete len:519 (-),score=104.47 TRINITY_DN744_c0_g1_i1:99-1655(-)